MTALSALRIGRRPLAGRVVLVHRGDPDVAAALLPPAVRPLLVGGRSVLFLCHTRLGRTANRWLPERLRGGFDHLTCHLAAEFPGAAGEPPTRGSWVLERSTSSWIEAHWGERLGAGACHRSSFELRERPFGVELTVCRSEIEELYLRGEPAPSTSGTLFPSVHAAQAFFSECGAVLRPRDFLASEAETCDPDEDAFSPEPLAVFEVRSRLLRDVAARHPGKGFQLDCAYRFVSKRVAPVAVPARPRVRRVLGAPATPALPAS